MNKQFTLLLFFLMFTFSLLVSGQEILTRIPAIPQDACSADPEDQKRFEEQVAVIIHDVSNNIRGLKEKTKPDEEKAKRQAEQMLLQQGLSAEEVEKMKNKDMSREEKEAMANRMMQQYTNMSMEEVNQMKTMSKEGRQAYTEAYAAEAQAAAQAKSKENPGAEPEMQNYAALLAERNDQYQKIVAREKTVMQKYNLVDKDPEGLQMVSEMDRLAGVMSRLVGGGGEGGWIAEEKEQYDKAAAELNSLKQRYCRHMSPLYANALMEHLTDLRTSYNQYLQLEESTGRIDNTVVTIGEPGAVGRITYLEWVITYLEKLREVYRYCPLEQ